MNITELLGRPVDTTVDFEDANQTSCHPPQQPEPPAGASVVAVRRGSWWTVLAGTVVLVIGFAAGALLTGRHDVNKSPAFIATAPAAVVPSNVGDFAELFVELHLSGAATDADMSLLHPDAAPAGTTGGSWVNHSAAVSTEILGEDRWLVTVAVEALERTGENYEAVGLQYFSVTVAAEDGRLVSVAAPARIPNPSPVRTPATKPSFNESVPADEASAVTSFLSAYLTGHGEVARFVNSTARVKPFAQPPYDSISVTTLTADSLGRVAVDLDAVTRRGAHHNLRYVMDVTFDSGLWEVADLASAPEAGR